MDKLRAMETVLRINETGSLTAAARALDSSLPAVVRTLAALERELGVRLFNRTTRRLAPTGEGLRYLERCRQLLALVAESEAELRDSEQAPHGLLRVTAPVLFGQLHVSDAITRFVGRYPGVRVDVHLLDRVVNLVEEGFDLAVRIGELENSSLVAQQVGRVRRVLVATPDYIARHGEPQHPADLAQHNCLRFSGAGATWWTFNEPGRGAGAHDGEVAGTGKRRRGERPFTVPVSGNLSFNQVAPLTQACIAGLGVGMFISYQVADAVRAGELRVMLADYEPPARPIHLVYPQSRLLPARTRALLEWLKVELRGMSERGLGALR